MPDPKFDDWMDAHLRNVAVPRDLLSRLREAAPRGNRVDDEIDAALRDVPVPLQLQWNLRQIARRRAPLSTWLGLGLAASVALIVSAGLIMYASSAVPPRGQPASAAVAQSVSPQSPHRGNPSPLTRPLNLPPGVDTVAQDASGREPAAGDPGANGPAPELPLMFESLAALGRSFREAAEVRARTQAALGAGGELAQLPRLDVFQLPARRGVTPPRLGGYDLLFQLRHGEHPFVSPSSHEELASSQLPLTRATTSYDLAAHALRQGQLPVAEEIRVEDFLAAQDFVLPKAPTDSLALHVAAARSPLGDDGLHALQVVVQAGAKRGASHPATRLILLLDHSWSMTDRVRWETALRALRMLAATMTPHDRVTLIGFAEHATMLAEDATAAQLAEFANGNSLPLPQGNANWPAAWRAAVDAAQAAAGPTLRRVVFLSPLEVEWTSAAIGEAAVALGKLHETQTPWHFIHVSTVRPPDPLAQLADKAKGQLATGSNASQIHAAMAQALTGRSGIVATGASVKLAFNPKAVSGYRLVGHEATTLTGEATDPLEIDLASGEQVVGFYELWVKPSSDQLIATVELTWRDGASGQPRKASQAIRRSQLIESFAGAPHWLQQGIVAAKAAEVLRGSHYAPTVRPYGQIRELAGQVDRQAAEQRSFQQLVELVEAAEKLR